MKNVSLLTFETLENEIETNQTEVFVRHFVSVISENDKSSFSFFVQNFFKSHIENNAFFSSFIKIIQKSNNDPIHQFIIATCLSLGCGIEKNLEESFTLYSKGAEIDYPRAIDALACCFHLGEGVEVDIEKSIQLF